MAKQAKLTPAQKREFERLYHNAAFGLTIRADNNLVKIYSRLVDKGLVAERGWGNETSYFLSEYGTTVAKSMFDPAESELDAKIARINEAFLLQEYENLHEVDTAPADTVTPTPETVASAAPVAANDTESPVADADIPFASGLDDGEPAYEVTHIAGLDGGYIVVDSDGQNLTQPTRIRGIADVLARKANDSEPVSSDNTTMPILAPVDGQNEARDAVQLSSTVKAPKAPVMTKKERRKQRQAELRQQYAKAKQQETYRKQQAIIQLFQQAWAVGKAA